MPEETPEVDEYRENSIGEEGGRSEGKYDLNEAMYNGEYNQQDDLYDPLQFENAGNPTYYTGQDEESDSNQGSEEGDAYF